MAWSHVRVQYLPVLFSYAAAGILRLILSTCTLDIPRREEFKRLSKKGKLILASWHHRLLLVPTFLWRSASFNHYHSVVSESRDGKLFTAFVNHCALAHLITVPKRNRKKALSEMVKILEKDEILLITPDGPRGPRCKTKPGMIHAARETGATIVPFSFSASKYWTLPTWDQMVIPKPFSKIKIKIGDPIEGEELKKGSDLKELSALIDQKMTLLEGELTKV